MEILFWRHQSTAQKRLKTCTLYCRLTINGERADLGSTNIEIPIEDFDTKGQEVNSSNPHSVQLNLRLQEEFKTPILTIYTDFLLKRQPISADAIKRIFIKVDKPNVRLLDAYAKFIADFKIKTKPSIDRKGRKKEPRRSASTIKPLNTCRNKILTYLIEQKEQHICIEELDENWFARYENWLYEINHEQSTIVKHLRTLKQITEWSFKTMKLASFDPFVHCKVEQEETKDPNFLTEEQFQRWISHKFSSKMTQEVADVFAIYCRTGFHYTDLKQVIENPSAFLKKGLDGNTWIYKPREKTEVKAKVPIAFFKEINPIIEKYGGWEKLPMKQNTHLNQWLKICAADINMHLPEELKIYEFLSVKHGRGTMTDYWFNELGNNDNSLLPILGRKSKAGLERYGRPDERAVIKDMNKKTG